MVSVTSFPVAASLSCRFFLWMTWMCLWSCAALDKQTRWRRHFGLTVTSFLTVFRVLTKQTINGSLDRTDPSRVKRIFSYSLIQEMSSNSTNNRKILLWHQREQTQGTFDSPEYFYFKDIYRLYTHIFPKWTFYVQEIYLQSILRCGISTLHLNSSSTISSCFVNLHKNRQRMNCSLFVACVDLKNQLSHSLLVSVCLSVSMRPPAVFHPVKQKVSLTDDDVFKDVGVVVRCGCHLDTVGVGWGDRERSSNSTKLW